jgi:hypothetical protein
MVRAYDEIVDFLAGGASPRELIAFRPSEFSRLRVAELIAAEKSGNLSEDERSELTHFLAIEHLMRLARARARTRLSDE